MAKLVGQNYTTPDLVAKVTGKAKYAEDFRAEGMLFAKLLLSPMPHARVVRIDTSAALACPGVKAILTADDLPRPRDIVTDLGQTIRANPKGERALTNEPVYEGEPILAVAPSTSTRRRSDREDSDRVRAAAVCGRSAVTLRPAAPTPASKELLGPSAGSGRAGRRPRRATAAGRRDGVEVDGGRFRRIRPGQAADGQAAR
jgi:hypothetical protein